jgi:hypothetical protein
MVGYALSVVYRSHSKRSRMCVAYTTVYPPLQHWKGGIWRLISVGYKKEIRIVAFVRMVVVLPMRFLPAWWRSIF